MNVKIASGVILATNLLASSVAVAAPKEKEQPKQPNIVFVFADQLRTQALGYAGDENVISPNIDKLASESINCVNAVSGMPVSTPYRAMLLTGQYALNNGLFLNDVQLDPEIVSAGKIFKAAGYETGYIGKWHLNGNGRTRYIAPEYRQGFDYFKALECTHNYLHSAYYDNNDTNIKYWEGYDAIDQTKDAIEYMTQKSKGDKPFVLYMSWGGPHSPYQKVPQEYLDMYENKQIKLRDNVPAEYQAKAIEYLTGYYAQITALDDCIGMLQASLEELGIDDNTIFVFTSDHGDMLGSHGFRAKQRPYDESIRVPFLIKYDALLGEGRDRESQTLLNTPDILPTLLGLSSIEIPEVIDGDDLTPILMGKTKDKRDAVLIECVTPFGEYQRAAGGREYRGVRTHRYTYAKDLNGAWLLFDNLNDPFQLVNLVDQPEYKKVQKQLEKQLAKILKERGDEFLPGGEYIKLWNYEVDESGTVDYKQYN